VSKIQIFDDVEVKLVQQMGSDASVVQAARVSVTGENVPDVLLNNRDMGLINYLMRELHGTPFESNAMTFYIKAPIVVAREFMRHRIGVSVNEMSGRYTVLPGEFYIPDADRKLINIGTSAKPEFALGDSTQVEAVQLVLEDSYKNSWRAYEYLLEQGIANEVARLALPVGIMTQWYATFNARSMMHFLSLRTQVPTAKHISRPQREIEMVAEKLEAEFGKQFPEVYAAYQRNGRVAP